MSITQNITPTFLVDVRTPEEFASGSVAHAVNIPLDEIQNRIEEFKDEENITVFCRSGARSSLAQQLLEQHGIVGVTNGGALSDVLTTYN